MIFSSCLNVNIIRPHKVTEPRRLNWDSSAADISMADCGVRICPCTKMTKSHLSIMFCPAQLYWNVLNFSFKIQIKFSVEVEFTHSLQRPSKGSERAWLIYKSLCRILINCLHYAIFHDKMWFYHKVTRELHNRIYKSSISACLLKTLVQHYPGHVAGHDFLHSQPHSDQ